MLIARVETLSVQLTTPTIEHPRSDTGGYKIARDGVGEAQERVDVYVPAVGAIGDLDDPRPAEEAPEQLLVLPPGRAAGDLAPGIA